MSHSGWSFGWDLTAFNRAIELRVRAAQDSRDTDWTAKTMRHLLFLALVALAACSGASPEGPATKNTAVAAATGTELHVAGFDPRGTRAGQYGELARLPDRGQLISYPAGTIARQDGAYTWHRAGVSEEHALRAISSRSLRMVTPSGDVLDIKYDHHVEHSSGDWSWVGHLAGDKAAQTILTFGSKAVFGTIGQAGKRSLRLTSRDGAAWIVETDPDKLVGLASEGANPSKPDHLSIPRQLLSSARVKAASAQLSVASAAAAAAPTTIDVLVGYTGGIASRTGGASAAQTLINSLVAVTNEAYANSQVNARVRLVHAMQVNYTDSSTNDSTLEQLTGYDVSSQQYTAPNAAFNSLRAAREQYGADLVVLLRQFRDPDQDGCGIAWLIGGGKSGIALGEGLDYFGYSVVSDGQDRNEQDGQTYYCRPESFAHELAHNMGSAHDRASAMGDDGVLDDPDDYGAFPYSFGYKSGTGNFFTVMAYGDEGQQDYRVFSNPRITVPCGNRACGTANDDNARSLAQTMPVVSGFRGAVVPITMSPFNYLSGDFNGDGSADLLWRNQATGADSIWRSANSATLQWIAAVTNLQWRVAAAADFDGNGRDDILWRNTTTGTNTIWKAANNTTQQSVTSVTNTQWQVAMAADFNADGRADILWNNPATGASVIWRSAQSTSPQSVTTVTNLSWRIVGVGDFNGDGRADILWRNGTTGANTIWKSGNSSNLQSVASVTNLSWQVAGVGDFNGDGRADILWRNETTGANTIWKSGNNATLQSVQSVTAAGWLVAAVGDFNGDAKADIVWRNEQSGANAIWYSASNPSVLPSVPDLNWTIVP